VQPGRKTMHGHPMHPAGQTPKCFTLHMYSICSLRIFCSQRPCRGAKMCRRGGAEIPKNSIFLHHGKSWFMGIKLVFPVVVYFLASWEETVDKNMTPLWKSVKFRFCCYRDVKD
jgi:hypothetical protein